MLHSLTFALLEGNHNVRWNFVWWNFSTILYFTELLQPCRKPGFGTKGEVKTP
jgi:hypothetical protein